MKSEIKIGSKLTAINECIMNGSNNKTLTIGKEYEIIKMVEEEICIVDDDLKNHYFEIEDISLYFITEEIKNKIFNYKNFL